MNRYETIFILEADIPDAEREPILEKVKSMIPPQNGVLLMFDDWGNRKLAYPIKKKMHGRYIRLDYCGIGKLVDDLERFFRLDHRVLKYMTILLVKDADPEALKEAMKSEQSQTQEADSSQTDEGAGADASDSGEEATVAEENIQPEVANEE
jgi:small subunit ribosomal protein S6